MKMDCSPFPQETTTVSGIIKYNRGPTVYTKCIYMVERFTLEDKIHAQEKTVSNITEIWTGKMKLLSK